MWGEKSAAKPLTGGSVNHGEVKRAEHTSLRNVQNKEENTPNTNNAKEGGGPRQRI